MPFKMHKILFFPANRYHQQVYVELGYPIHSYLFIWPGQYITNKNAFPGFSYLSEIGTSGLLRLGKLILTIKIVKN